MNFKRILPILFVGLIAPFFIKAQVTTSSITGFVKSVSGEALEGATITAIHVPSGTKYFTVSQKNGVFNIPNARIGGPYTISAESVGYATQTYQDVTLRLGEAFNAQFTLSGEASVLSEITITASGRPTTIKTGASTNINARQIATLPSYSRSVTDLTRLTPQASGTSFAGRDGRFNNLQVDGANLNNNFGLSSDPLPGGGASPISIETFDEISINIAPFDVRQSGFTGAGLNITTKSGTNTFHGSAYGFYRDQTFQGKYVGKTKLPEASFSKNKSYGATLGGPIIKDKLFFFGNIEVENNQVPNPTTWLPTGLAGVPANNQSASPKDSLEKFKQYLLSKYGYDAGSYDQRPNFVTKNTKWLAKLDWNISNKHKLTLKYSDYSGSDQAPVNGSSVPNSASGGFSITNPITGVTGSSQGRLPNNRNSNQAIALSNSDYGFNHVVQSGSAELNSNFSSRWSNQLLLTYTHINDTRFSPGGIFPTIEIFNGDGTVAGVTPGRNYMTAGTDPFTNNNDVVNNIAIITDNVTHFAGKHTITAGVTYEQQKVGNAFMAGSESYYIYNTLNEFMNDAPPAFYSYTYSLVPGQKKVFSANLKFGQLGAYIQDEINFNPNFKLTYGLRVDAPIYLEQPIENPAISALQFPNKDGVMTNYSTGSWPKGKLMLSPRAGFRWKVPSDPSLVIRGGVGVFAGRIPFVFLTNMPTNSGVYQNGVVLNQKADLASIKFNPDPDAYRGLFPDQVTAKAPGSFVLIDPEFKFPKILRTNFGVEKQLGNGFSANLDILYTKDLHAVRMRNVNLIAPTGVLQGEDSRPYYPTTQVGSGKSVNPALGNIIMLENVNKGYSFSTTAQISKRMRKGFYGSLAYTYTLATEVSPNPGSQANSAWQSIINRGTPNEAELYYSAYGMPHRIVGNISYRLEYGGHFATTLSLYYEGANNSKYSYIVGGDLNRDGNNASDLMYIYAKGSDVPFVVNGAFSIADQQKAYDDFVASSPYLSRHKGQYAERNAALTPWFNRVDARLLQDFYIKAGGQQHNLQFIVDIVNLPNLLVRSWGIRQGYTVNNPLTLKGVDANGKPTFTMATQNIGGTLHLRDAAFSKLTSYSTTWGMNLGIKYFF